MFWSKRQRYTQVVWLGEQELRFICIEHKSGGRHEIVSFGKETLAKQVISNGEILKPIELGMTLKSLRAALPVKDIHVLLPVSFFDLRTRTIARSVHDKKSVLKRISAYLKSIKKTESWVTNQICDFDSNSSNTKDHVVFRCLNKDVASAYEHVFQDAKFRIRSLSPDVFSLFTYGNKEPRLEYVIFGKEATRIMNVEHGIFVSEETIPFGEDTASAEIRKHAGLNNERARAIFREYGVLRSHKEAKVYHRLQDLVKPLAIRYRGHQSTTPVSVVFEQYEIPGILDVLRSSHRGTVDEFPIRHMVQHYCGEVLPIDARDLYDYQYLLARAMQSWHTKH
jgi:Tfp pilus assembly PilM family ATPase